MTFSINTAMFAISTGSIFKVDYYACTAVAISTIACGLGIACDVWFPFRYIWVDLNNIDEKQNGHLKSNGLAGHDHSDIPQSLTLDSAPTPGPRLDASSSLSVRISSPDDSVHHTNVHPRYETPCSE
jgi:hypothetical protein